MARPSTLHATSMSGWGALLLILVGCGSQRAQDVWAMPQVGNETSPVAARTRGFPFGSPGSGIVGGDQGGTSPTEGARGDLPESTYLEKRRGFWHHDERVAASKARRTGRAMLVNFWADWCEECRDLDDRTFRDPEVRSTIFRGFIPLRVDVSEESREGRGQLSRYRVDHLPAILLIDEEGREVDRIEAFVPEQEMLDRLLSVRPTDRSSGGVGR